MSSDTYCKYKFLPVEKIVSRAELRKKVPKAAKPKVTPPAAFSMRSQVTEVYDQGELGSCTANAFCGAFKLLEKDKTFEPSRLWVYYYSRLLEDPKHNPADLKDTGADVIDGEYYVENYGVCSEKLLPYDISKYNNPPTQQDISDAVNHKISSHLRIKYSDIKSFISSSHPVLIAILVYRSFFNPVQGKISIPAAGEQLMGGHELCVVGYDDSTGLFEVLNSWGSAWGDHGFCYIPYAYLSDTNLCREITVINM